MGTDYKVDMEKIKNAPRMKEWWDMINPMQERIGSAKPGEWWAGTEEVFHTD